VFCGPFCGVVDFFLAFLGLLCCLGFFLNMGTGQNPIFAGIAAFISRCLLVSDDKRRALLYRDAWLTVQAIGTSSANPFDPSGFPKRPRDRSVRVQQEHGD